MYVQITATAAMVFVRDEGHGFDPAAIPGDRRGLRDSITRRLAAHGGSAHVVSSPGAGAELELSRR